MTGWLSAYDFELPAGLIAQEPYLERDRSKLLVLVRRSGDWEHRTFFEIENYLKPGDVLVVNNTQVVPVRLVGKRNPGRGWNV